MSDSTSSQNRNPGAVGTTERPTQPPLSLLRPRLEDSATPLSRFDLWLHRLTVLLFVFVCAVVGVLLVIVPWRPEWTDNRFFLTYPALRDFFSNGFVRGLCSGLGVLDIWIGFWEAVHYNEGN